MIFEIILKSIIIGFIGGAAISAGAARMFKAPEVQGMGAFRTLGELNACNGDPVSHFSFGLGFLFNAAAATVASGALTQDVFHRIIPNWSVGALLTRDRNVEETLHNPEKMFFMGGIIGAVVVLALNTISYIVPSSLSTIAAEVLAPAANLMISTVMPIVFWLAALDSSKTTGIWATVLGGISHMVSGNATPGIVLGILIGESAVESGYGKATNILITIVTIMFIAIAYFRGFFEQLIGLF